MSTTVTGGTRDAHIRVMFTAGTEFSSRLIEWFGGGNWSHMANILPNGTVIDARSDIVKFQGRCFPTGVQHRPKGYLQAESPRWVEIEIPCSTAQARAWEECLWSQVHKPYDTVGIVGFVTGSLKDRNWRDQSAWFCSELGVWAQEKAGICPPLAAPVFKIPPGEGLLIAMALGGKVVASHGLSKRLAAA
jgi:hypothetical protein